MSSKHPWTPYICVILPALTFFLCCSAVTGKTAFMILRHALMWQQCKRAHLVGVTVYAPDQIESRAMCNDGVFKIHILSYTWFTCQLLVRVGVKMTKSSTILVSGPAALSLQIIVMKHQYVSFLLMLCWGLPWIMTLTYDILRYPSYQLRPDLPPYWVSPAISLTSIDIIECCQIWYLRLNQWLLTHTTSGAHLTFYKSYWTSIAKPFHYTQGCL